MLARCGSIGTPVTSGHRCLRSIFFHMKYLRFGPLRAIYVSMKNIPFLTIVLICFLPAEALAGNQKQVANINEQYVVEGVELTGVAESKIGKALRDDMQKLVGEKFNQAAADELAGRLRYQLSGYTVSLKVKRGDKEKQVKVVFAAERSWWRRFEINVPPVVYHSKEGFSGTIELPLETHHNVFTFGAVNSADELLERNAGFRFRYEHRKVGTDMVQLRIDFDTYHQKWNPATEAALADSPEVPGVYRWRQNFAPSLSLIPFRDLKISVGTSFVRLETQYPTPHTETAYAGTADIQYRRRAGSGRGYRQDFRASYSLRTATRILESDFLYTRHHATADYTLSKGKNLFGAHFQGGLLIGSAPLFERFSLGNSCTLRGWNKFDVAPLGATRLAHGSLEYRYRPFQVFYDVGAVWDSGQDTPVRHGFGFGLAFRNGGFISLAIPIRLHRVTPLFMFGFRF
jgi:hypothetical protein